MAWWAWLIVGWAVGNIAYFILVAATDGVDEWVEGVGDLGLPRALLLAPILLLVVGVAALAAELSRLYKLASPGRRERVRLERGLAGELKRLGLDRVIRMQVRSARTAARPLVRFAGDCFPLWHPNRPLTWEGDASAAVETLSHLPDGAGGGAFWAALRPDLLLAKLAAELDRSDVSRARTTDDDSLGYVDLTRRSTRGVLLRGYGPLTAKWEGDVGDALERVETVPDNAGVAAFWAAFPDARPFHPG